MRTSLKDYNNNGFTTGRGKIITSTWFLVNALIFQTSIIPFSGFKVFLLRLFGAIVGTEVRIKPSVNIKYPWKLEIGSYVWIGENVWIDNLAKVYIGDNTCISQGAMLLTGNHNYKKEAFDLIIKEIKLDDGVWIGARAVVCPGVYAGSHSVLTVGAVATKDLAPFIIYSGNPAIKIKSRIIKG